MWFLFCFPLLKPSVSFRAWGLTTSFSGEVLGKTVHLESNLLPDPGTAAPSW